MNRRNVIWNMVGTLIYSIATILLATVVKRIMGIEAGDDFTIAFKLGQTLLTVGYFEVRLFQVTDEREEYQFQDYFSFRLITCVLMMLCCLVYLLVTGRSGAMYLLILTLCLFKMTDALADVFEGDYQKHERLDLSGKSLTIRTLASVAIFTAVLLAVRNTLIASAAMTVTAFLVICAVNPRMRRAYGGKRGFAFRRDKLRGLFSDCFFLALGAFLCNYILNGVVFAVDAHASDCNYIFGALFMPTSVINLFSGMIFKPVLTTLTSYYDQHRYGLFLRLLGVLMGVAAGLTVICLAGAWLLGVPVLSLIYAVDLSPYKAELLLLIVGGGLNAAGILVYYGLVVMRQQRRIFGCYLLTFLITCILPYALVKRMQIRGAAIAFVLVMLVQLLVFLALLLGQCRKESREYENG